MPEHTVLEDYPQPPSPSSSDEGETKFDFSGWSLDGGRIDVTKFLRIEPEDDDLRYLDLGLKLDLASPAPVGAKQPDFGEVDPEGFPSGTPEPVSPPDFGEVDPEGVPSSNRNPVSPPDFGEVDPEGFPSGNPDPVSPPDFGEVDPEDFPSGTPDSVSPPDFGEVDPEGFDSGASPVDWVELLDIFAPDTLDLWPG